MQIQIHDESRMAEVWLTQAERDDPAVMEQLKPLYARCRARQYTVAVFLSGREDVYQNTLALLSYNKRRLAALEVRKEKESADKRA